MKISEALKTMFFPHVKTPKRVIPAIRRFLREVEKAITERRLKVIPSDTISFYSINQLALELEGAPIEKDETFVDLDIEDWSNFSIPGRTYGPKEKKLRGIIPRSTTEEFQEFKRCLYALFKSFNEGDPKEIYIRLEEFLKSYQIYSERVRFLPKINKYLEKMNKKNEEKIF